MVSKSPAENPLRYGYFLVAAAGVLQIIMWGLFTTYGVYFIPMQDDFGWSRAAISGARSFSMVVWGSVSIVLGSLSDKYGPRIIMTVCGLFFGAGYFLMSQVNSLWQLYALYGIIIGIGVSATDVVVLSTVARWFTRRRGMMTGIVKVGTGIGMFALPLAAERLMSAYGWRISYMVLGGIGLVTVVSVSQFLRQAPERTPPGLEAGRRAVSAKVEAVQSGISLHDAVRTPGLWLTCTMYLATWFFVNIIMVHLAPHAVDMGISQARAAGILASIGVVSIFGRLAVGFSSDRTGCRKAMMICAAVFVISFSLLLVAREFWSLSLFAVVYGFAHGGFATLISPLVGELFGLRSHGAILGVIIFFGTLGGAIGPIFAGYLFDATGSYQSAFIVSLAMSIAGLLMATKLRPLTAGESA